MAILPRTAYSIVFRLGDIVSMVRRFVLGSSVRGVVAVVVVAVKMGDLCVMCLFDFAKW